MSKFYACDEWGSDTVYAVTGNKRRKISLRHDLFNWSKVVAWGTAVHPGASQLALAILADHLKDDLGARKMYMRFKYHEVASRNMKEPFQLRAEEIDARVNMLRRDDLETNRAKTLVDKDRPIPMSESGPGITWDRVDKITPNKREN